MNQSYTSEIIDFPLPKKPFSVFCAPSIHKENITESSSVVFLNNYLKKKKKKTLVMSGGRFVGCVSKI